MCGICGYIGNQISENQLIEMNNTMYHRGPNDAGIWQTKFCGKSMGLAQRRLAILDLSELGHQPMHYNNGDFVIVFNGEIYNYKLLREELRKQGHHFVSDCDTEVILAAYAQWGEQAVYRLEGMFAYAIYDRKRNRVILARDRIGKKPLYYYWDGFNFIFGSELKAIVKSPWFQKEINTEVIEKYLCYQYINEPDTIYKNTFKLPAAHYMIFDGENIEIQKYWDLFEKFTEGKEQQILDYEECKKELKKTIYKSVEDRLVADVPVGTFLSGGIDSTLVTAVANDIIGGSVKTFTIGFDEKERNEATFAEETAKYLQTEHTELYVTEKDMLDMIQDVCVYFDEPFADPSEIPTMLVSKLAKEKVTVALSGDGGDEFFCGYSMYDFVYYAQKLDLLAGVGNRILNNKSGNKIKRKLPQEAVALLENREKTTKVQLFEDLPEKFVARMLKKSNGQIKYLRESEINVHNWQEKRMLLDMYTYLPEDVLTKADRASMKYSLEMRCPLLDQRVMECSFRIPHKYKYHSGSKKYILKDILYDYVPKEMMDRPKKGFGVPLGKWLRTYLKEEVARVSQKSFIEEQGFFNYDVVQELISKVEKSDKKPYPKILWAYYIFQLWYMKYCSQI